MFGSGCFCLLIGCSGRKVERIVEAGDAIEVIAVPALASGARAQPRPGGVELGF
jgi:hypothetical protein